MYWCYNKYGICNESYQNKFTNQIASNETNYIIKVRDINAEEIKSS